MRVGAAQTIRALSANDIPDAKRISMRMYLQLAEPLEREELVHRRRMPTILSRAFAPDGQFDLDFTQTGDGQVEITSLSRLSRARILDSIEVRALRPSSTPLSHLGLCDFDSIHGLAITNMTFLNCVEVRPLCPSSTVLGAASSPCAVAFSPRHFTLTKTLGNERLISMY